MTFLQSYREIWKPIVNYESFYEVSNLGNVRRIGKDFLKPSNNRGYLKVTLSSHGKPRDFSVHRLVANAFLGEILGKVINHLNFDKKDNRVENLEICSQSRNNQHACDGGRRPSKKGEAHHNCIFNDHLILLIRRMVELGLHDKEIASIVNTQQYNISRIRLRKRWNHL